MRMAVNVKIAVPGMGLGHVRVMTDPQGDPLGHARVLDEDPLDIDDGAGPFEPLAQPDIVVAPDQVDATVQARPDDSRVVQAAPVGEVPKVPDNVLGSDGLILGGNQGLVMGLDGLERTGASQAGTEPTSVAEMGVGCQQGS